MITSLRTTIMAAFCMAALAVVGVADAANEKERVRDRFGGTYELAVDCSPYGYAFEVLVAGSERGSITDVLDGEGNLLRTVLHISLEETNVNERRGEDACAQGPRAECLGLHDERPNRDRARVHGKGGRGEGVPGHRPDRHLHRHERGALRRGAARRLLRRRDRPDRVRDAGGAVKELCRTEVRDVEIEAAALGRCLDLHDLELDHAAARGRDLDGLALLAPDDRLADG